MCPWEHGTVQREQMALNVDQAKLMSIPSSKKALWRLSLINLSPMEENLFLRMKLRPETNKNGLKLWLNGIRLNAYDVPGLRYDKHEFLLEGDRQPNFWDYTDIEIRAVSRCEDNLYIAGHLDRPPIGSSATIAAHFLKPCPPVTWAGQLKTLLEADMPWVVSLSSPSLSVPLLNEGFWGMRWAHAQRMLSLTLQYRRASSDVWHDVDAALDFKAAENNLGLATLDWTPTALMPDGAYFLRAKTTCNASSNPSYDAATTRPLRGVLDRTAPHKFGSQEPSDLEYWPGDGITITFDEALDCSLPYQFTAALQKGEESLPGVVVCEGRTVHLEFGGETDYDGLLGGRVEAMVSGVKDLAGNLQDVSYRWSFDVAAFDPHLASVDVKDLRFAPDLEGDLTSAAGVADFKGRLKSDVAAAVGVSPARIAVGQVSAGADAVVVDVSILPAADGGTATSATRAGAMLCGELKDGGSALRSGTLFGKYQASEAPHLAVRPGLADPATVLHARAGGPGGGLAATANGNEAAHLELANKQDVYSFAVLGVLLVNTGVLVVLVVRRGRTPTAGQRGGGGDGDLGQPALKPAPSLLWTQSPMRDATKDLEMAQLAATALKEGKKKKKKGKKTKTPTEERSKRVQSGISKDGDASLSGGGRPSHAREYSRHVSVDGDAYFMNTETGESVWTLPSDAALR